MKYLLPLILLFLLSSCNKEDYHFIHNGEGINIFLVKEGQIERSQIEVDFDSLELEKLPWINQAEIDFYDWSAHTFYLKVKKERAKYSGNYFLVKHGYEPLFLGYFFPPPSSSFSYFPSVTAWDDGFYPNDVVELGGFGGFYKDTMNTFVQFKNALKKENLFREGINVELLSVTKKNSTTVEYTFQVKNLENDIIFVLDPNKTGTKHFHYYTNGVTLIKGTEHYSAEFQSESPDNGIPKEWFETINPGGSMIRSVELGDFIALPSGTVTCRFSFPGHYPKNSSWKNKNGRFWLGDYWIKKELVLD